MFGFGFDHVREELEIEYNSRFDDHNERWAAERADMEREAEMEADYHREMFEEDVPEDDIDGEWEPDVDETNYDPYAGCDTYDYSGEVDTDYFWEGE